MRRRTQLSHGHICPCPFCGSHAFAWREESKDFKGEFGWRIICANDLCGCRTPLFADAEAAMRIWNKRTEYSLLNWKIKTTYETLFAKVEHYARMMQEVFAREPMAVGAIIDDLFDFANYFADPKNARLLEKVSSNMAKKGGAE